jgi:phosphatidylinositol alpha 1,6-mannosyltransferase
MPGAVDRPPLSFFRSTFVLTVKNIPRVAFFPDSYLEINGAAMTCKRLTDYAASNGYPYLVVHAGKRTGYETKGAVEYLSLKRTPFSFPLDEDLAYDPLFQRHTNRVLRKLIEFKPDVIHVTGINDVSIIGSYLAWKLQLPLVGSWHTNVHEFAAQRLDKLFSFVPGKSASKITRFAERKILDGAVLYYKMPKVVLAPNKELVELLGKGTGRTARLMGRGVDAEKFSPQHRTVSDNVFRLGSVGRLRAEKNVRALIDIERALISAGMTNFEFLIVGEGSEREHLEKHMKYAKFTGFLSGDALSEAYANMDVFLFTSETDAFGNVAQEASASGVVPIVSDKGGPKYLVEHGESGFVAKDIGEFISYTKELMLDRLKLLAMKEEARERALSKSWDSVFESVYEGYNEALRIAAERKQHSAANGG